MIQYFTHNASENTVIILGCTTESFQKDRETWPDHVRIWAEETGFNGKARTLKLVSKEGALTHVLYGISQDPYDTPWDAAVLATRLPKHKTYQFQNDPSEDMVMAWALASYNFQAAETQPKPIPVLALPKTLSLESIQHALESIQLARNLINIPANLMTPKDLAHAAKTLAQTHSASFEEIVGDRLLNENYPLIHTVGRAAATPPRFVHVQWGNPNHYHLALVGKGITFDTGGLNIKTGHYMTLMKKDMGGAAHALGLAHWIMSAKLPIYLNLYLPIAENAVGSHAMRPGDVVKARNGLRVEIADTDAEGRLILADALARATEESPDLIIDFATLTGAARVALGTEIPAFFTNCEEFQESLVRTGLDQKDPVWPLPLWQGYAHGNKSSVADLKNIPATPYGGAIGAALFLSNFIEETPWIHTDLMAWNIRERPGRPIGGEAQSLKTFFHFVKEQSTSMKN